ncbi:hypothetical protein E8E15_001481 [Penicillium rubens]|jgi:hypothetical protein|nr:hypothetical protein E8E15_001481 [Penicillium rubens]KAJ5050174.1 hypothetical protein NUH16_008713 [Penicillium rubens]
MGLEASLTGFNDWSFGQVTAVVLLAAPLISIIEYFMEGESGDYYLGSTERSNTRVEKETRAQDETPPQDETPTQDEEQPVSDGQTVTPLPSIANPTTIDPNDPDNDWISHPKILGPHLHHLFVLTFMIILWTADRDPFGKMSYFFSSGVLIFMVGFATPVLILCSLMVDTIFAERKATIDDNMEFVLALYSVAIMLCQNYSIAATIAYCVPPLAIIGALVARFWS